MLVYFQVTSIDKQANELPVIQNIFLFITGIILVVPNMWLVYLMWRAIIKKAELSASKQIRIQSFYAGLVTGMLTPNMVGNFIGRLYYFDKEHHGVITVLTLLSNYAQFLISILFGCLSFWAIGSQYEFMNHSTLNGILLVALLFFFVIYFNFEKMVGFVYRKVEKTRFNEILQQNRLFRWELLGLSAIRFVVFTTQFALILGAFGVKIDLELIFTIWQIYLVTMLAPSLFLGKIGVKESISLFMLSTLGINAYIILFSSLIIWFVNSLAPALVGLIVCHEKGKNGGR